ncbi:sensor histidine kinase [Actinomadura oligospora]|uniref:sensor histidine kinase n=1 Tax=Actinomadura oligospora TaxID=111804 RepID=UPI00047D25B6|nr:HAMP domain-containing sensor histidine kinase [Actinomadura oligospora]
MTGRTGGLLWRTSLRTRLLCLSVALVAVGLLAAGAVVTLGIGGYLQGRLDDRLTLTAEVASRAPLPPASNSRASIPALSVLGDTTITFADDKGSVRRVYDAGTALPGGGPKLPGLDRAAVTARKGRPFTVQALEGDHPWRVVTLPRSGTSLLGPPERAASGSIAVATSLDEIRRTIARTGLFSLIAGLALLAVLAAAGWIAVRSSLRPLTRIEETTTAIAAGDYSHRVPELAGPRTEVGHLTSALNRMLAEIDTAFRDRAEAEARTRRFFADASHELRTPLVGIRGYTDLYRLGALPTRADVDRTMDRIAAESARLTRLVEDMFLLARVDEAAHGSAFDLDLAPMDLRTLAADALHDVRALDAARPVTLTGPDGGRPSSAPALADEARLRQVVTNLVGNAVAHTPPGTPVRIGVGTIGDHAVLEVADQGPGLTSEERRHVFDRFYRTDDSRNRTTGGSGLGLPIAQALVTAHNGELDLRTAPGEGATFRILLPLLRDTVPPDA